MNNLFSVSDPSDLSNHLDLSESGSQAWRLFLFAYARVTERIEQDLAAANLPSLAWYDVLWTLERSPNHEMRLHELAAEVLLSRSNITRLIDRLEAAELLCRKRCPNDRRGAYAVLTAKGLALRQQMWQVYSTCIQRYFASHLEDQDAADLSTVFQRILEALKDGEERGERSAECEE